MTNGEQYNKEIGLYYYRARYYDAKAGRFISRDPIGFWGGVNVYGYVKGNPVNRIDPFGFVENPLPKLPPFTDAFPDSKLVAPIADVVIGGIEAGGATVIGVVAVVSLLDPLTWPISLLAGPASIDAGYDAGSRITTGIEALLKNSNDLYQPVNKPNPCPK